jgi:hypothetical protein
VCRVDQRGQVKDQGHFLVDDRGTQNPRGTHALFVKDQLRIHHVVHFMAYDTDWVIRAFREDYVKLIGILFGRGNGQVVVEPYDW